MVTIEQAFTQLSAEFGEAFCWSEIEPGNKYFIEEAIKEIGQSHSLFKCLECAVAKCDSNDDVLFLMRDGSYAIVHLTYSKNTEAGYPRYVPLLRAGDVAEYIKMHL